MARMMGDGLPDIERSGWLGARRANGMRPAALAPTAALMAWRRACEVEEMIRFAAER